MQAVLNFRDYEKGEVKKFLEGFQKEKNTNKFEEFRGRVDGCTVILYSSGKLLIQGNNAEEVKEKILAGLQLKDELVLGIDEAGRGEAFGPFVVAGVLGFSNMLREMRDSKKTRNISEKASVAKKNSLDREVISFSAGEIDRLRAEGKNMNMIEAEAINSIIAEISKRHGSFRIIVDGAEIKGVGKKAEFLPKADDKIAQVSAASIVARAERERSSDREERKSWKVS